MVPRVRHRARCFHVRTQRAIIVSFRQGRDKRHELRRKDERATDTPEPDPEAGRARGGSRGHLNDTNDTTVSSASL